MITYGFTREVDLSFKDAVARVTALLKQEGFGVLSKIDIREKFKEKLGIDFRNYVILGSCHPRSAYKAIVAEEDIGLMLPCNVIVYDRAGRTVVSVIKPTVAMGMIQNSGLKQIAEDIEHKLNRVIEELQ